MAPSALSFTRPFVHTRPYVDALPRVRAAVTDLPLTLSPFWIQPATWPGPLALSHPPPPFLRNQGYPRPVSSYLYYNLLLLLPTPYGW